MSQQSQYGSQQSGRGSDPGQASQNQEALKAQIREGNRNLTASTCLGYFDGYYGKFFPPRQDYQDMREFYRKAFYESHQAIDFSRQAVERAKSN